MNSQRSRARIAQPPPPSIADLRLKLSRIISRHDQLKVAFCQLHSQIRTGLLEAEHVFASLAVPLMKLVGLKTAEMAEEGRFSTVITNNDDSNSQDCWRNDTGSRLLTGSILSNGETDQYQRDGKSEENWASKATMASKELMQKQKLQLVQLVHILKQIESQVNSSQDDILQTLAARQEDIRKIFQRAVRCISVVHQAGQDNDICLITLKLLKAAFDHIGAAFCSVEDGVEDMIHNLAEKMCIPMVKYAQSLKAEMTTGTFAHLVSIVEEMGGAMRIARLQLAEARIQVKEAEETRLEALQRVKKLEETQRKMKEHHSFLLEANRGSQGHSMQQKLLGREADEKNDEQLLWELHRSKRKHQLTESPQGPNDLLGIATYNKKSRSTKAKPSTSCRTTKRSHTPVLSPQTPRVDSWIPLGSSPSTIAQQVLTCRHITP